MTEKEKEKFESLKKELTIVICAYKANSAFTLCLHQIARYGFTGDNLLIYENSPTSYVSNRNLLNKYNIPYVNNPDGTHHETVERALTEVKTKYMLLLDSDCFCIRNPIEYLDRIKSHKITLFGEIMGNRGSFRIHKRVHPWWCIIDVDFIRKHKIQFCDMERMKASNSISFIDRKQLGNDRNIKGYYYDAGSTMYEDVLLAGGVAADIGDIYPYIHVEGASWRHDFENFKEDAVRTDNWTKLLYTKLQFEEKYLALLKKQG